MLSFLSVLGDAWAIHDLFSLLETRAADEILRVSRYPMPHHPTFTGLTVTLALTFPGGPKVWLDGGPSSFKALGTALPGYDYIASVFWFLLFISAHAPIIFITLVVV